MRRSSTVIEGKMDQQLQDLEQKAILLLRENVPPEGYYVAFSGGKDSCVIKELCKRSGVKHEVWYNNVTIDPPELVRFIKQYHPEVKWNQPKHGNMMQRVATRKGLPPTRSIRWCCSEYKEMGGHGRVKVFGVRATESKARAARWKEVCQDAFKNTAICPIVYWKDEDVWGYIKQNNLPYCSLYDEGFTRLGCVGCPLTNRKVQESEFKRWPKFGENWKRAIIRNWENFHDKLKRNGEPYYHSKFRSGEDMWEWWLSAKQPDYFREGCQSVQLFTNQEIEDIPETQYLREPHAEK